MKRGLGHFLLDLFLTKDFPYLLNPGGSVHFFYTVNLPPSCYFLFQDETGRKSGAGMNCFHS